MLILGIVLSWVHIITAMIFMGTMFFATFCMMPVVKKELDECTRQLLLTKLIPRIRKIMVVVILLLIISGISKALLLHFTYVGIPVASRFVVFAFKMLLAALPISIFALAPKILGAKSKSGLCCDPDAKGKVFGGVATKTGAILHYIAIGAGWLTILMGIILGIL